MVSKIRISPSTDFYFKNLSRYIQEEFRDSHNKSQQKIVLLFIDGFGWNMFKKHMSSIPSLQKMTSISNVIKTISLFPSSTPAHLSTIQGQVVYQTGITEWLYFNRFVGQTISPLMFSSVGNSTCNQLSLRGIQGSDIFSFKTVYQSLNNLNIVSQSYIPVDLINSEFTISMSAGSLIKGYKNVSSAMFQVSTDLIESPSSGYYFLYYDKIDKISHKFGTGSIEVQLALDDLFSLIDDLMIKPVQKNNQKMQIVICSDHGQISCPKTLELEGYTYPFQKYFKKDLADNPLVPGGSGRDVSLYVKKLYQNFVLTELRKSLSKKAKVILADNFIKTDPLCQEKLSSQYIDSIGDILILPNENYQFWWKELGDSKRNYIGNHGGITPDEIETPLLIFRNH